VDRSAGRLFATSSSESTITSVSHRADAKSNAIT
jgi:hypothetical protein